VGIFPLTSPNQNIGGCVPGIPGEVDASEYEHYALFHLGSIVREEVLYIADLLRMRKFEYFRLRINSR